MAEGGLLGPLFRRLRIGGRRDRGRPPPINPADWIGQVRPPEVVVPNAPPPGDVEYESPPVEVPEEFPEPEPDYPLETLDREPITLRTDPWHYPVPRWGIQAPERAGKYEIPADDLGQLIEAAERYKREGYDEYEFRADYELGAEFSNLIWGWDEARRPVPSSPRGPLRRAGRKSPRGAKSTRPRGARQSLAPRRSSDPTGLVPTRPRRLPEPQFGRPGGALALRAPRRAPERPGFPTNPNIPFPTRIPPRAPPRPRPRSLEELLRDFQRIPWPTPDERAPYPVPEPRRSLPPKAPPVIVDDPPELSPVPAPSIPVPRPRLPEIKPDTKAPPNPVLTPPRPPARQRQPARARPARVRTAVRVAQGLGAASILRPILRRNSEERLALQLPRVAPPARIDNPIEERLQPEPSPIDRLTPLQQPGVPYAALAPQFRRASSREEECVCEETPEEKEEKRERNRSNKVATVKSFKRRMSQNSLDNLRKGF